MATLLPRLRLSAVRPMLGARVIAALYHEKVNNNLANLLHKLFPPLPSSSHMADSSFLCVCLFLLAVFGSGDRPL